MGIFALESLSSVSEYHCFDFGFFCVPDILYIPCLWFVGESFGVTMAPHNIGTLNIILLIVMVTVFRLGIWFGRNWTQTFAPCVALTGIDDDESDTKFIYRHKRFRIHDPKPISKPTVADSAQPPSSMTTLKARERDGGEVVFKRNSLINKFSSSNNKIKFVTKKMIVDDVLVKKMKIMPNKMLPDSAASIRTVPDYVQIREADSPGVGDFNCGGTEVEGSCAFYVDGIEHAKKICNSFSDYCRGFVLTPQLAAQSPPLLLESTPGQHLVYLKTKVDEMKVNFLTDFFVKTNHMKEIGWKFHN